MTRRTTHGQWPDGPDEYPDFLWPDENEQDDAWPDSAGTAGHVRGGVAPDAHVPVRWEVPPTPGYGPPARRRIRSVLALAGTAVLACGLGAAAVLAYRGAEPASAPAAAPSQGSELAPGQGGGPAGRIQAEQMALVGRVTAVGSGTVTIAAGPQAVRAAVAAGTRFTGAVRTLAGVRAGDIVAAEITIVNGVARVVSLQDPATDS